MHGLAGSAALVALAASAAPSVPLGLAFMALFGLGSIAGMALFSAVIAVPLSYSGTALTWAAMAGLALAAEPLVAILYGPNWAEVAPLLSELKRVSDAWLAVKEGEEKGFVLGAFSEAYMQVFDLAVLRRGAGGRRY